MLNVTSFYYRTIKNKCNLPTLNQKESRRGACSDYLNDPHNVTDAYSEVNAEEQVFHARSSSPLNGSPYFQKRNLFNIKLK